MKEILTSRPDGMTFDEYRLMLKLQNKTIRRMHRNQPDKKIQGMTPIKFGYNSHV